MRTVRPPKAKRYRAGPWLGMRQGIATDADQPSYAERIQNAYLRDTDIGPVAVGRPGFTLLGVGSATGATSGFWDKDFWEQGFWADDVWQGMHAAAPATVQQLGSVGLRTGQLIYHWTRQDGAEFRIAIVGGQFYTYDPVTDLCTEVVTTANLTSASVTLSPTARCYAVTFANQVIITDGINKPWAWNGTLNGGVTKLTNAPVFYGQPWVWNGCLFAIKGTTPASRISIVWSEVGQPNTGYEAGGFLNIWDVAQTSQAIFYAGTATNDAMILARSNSTTRVTGTTTLDLQTSANHEGVHEFVGTISPGSMIVYHNVVYFFANSGGMFKVEPGAAAKEIAVGAREYLSRAATTKFGLVEGFVWDTGAYGEFLCWSLVSQSADVADTLLIVDPDSGELIGFWDGWQHDRIGVWKDNDGVPHLVHIGGADAQTHSDGYLYLHGNPTENVWDDHFHAGDATIAQSVTTHAMAWDEAIERQWDVADLSMLMLDNITNLGVQAETPYGFNTALATGSIAGGGARFDIDLFDVGVFAGDGSERKLAVGIDTAGRWCKLTVNHYTAGEQFAMQSVSVRAYVISDQPDVA